MGMSAGGGSILVVDVGTSGVRAAIVRPDATVEHEHRVPSCPTRPLPAWWSSTPRAWPTPSCRSPAASLEAGVRSPESASPTSGHRAWCGSAPPGRRVAPGIGWQDLRTVGTCLVLQAEGIRLAPNASATKVMAILDEVDPERVPGRAGRALLRDGGQLGGLDPLGRGGAGAKHCT